MSRRTAIIGLTLSLILLVFTGLVAAGVSTPGPHIKEWLGIDEPPLPDLCEPNAKYVREPPGKQGPGHWRVEPSAPDPSPEPGAIEIGDYVYMVGGQKREGTEALNLRFDARTGKYKRLADAPVAIDHPVVAKHDGEVILASGYVDGETATGQMWAYNPETDEWRELPPMRTLRGAAGGAVIGDKLYVAGGLEQFGNEYKPYDTMEIFDFETEEWEDGPSMHQARHHFDVAVVDGKLFAAGGRVPSNTSLSSFEEFDPERGTWRVLPPIPTGSGSPGVTAIDGKVVVTGGGDEVVPGDTGDTGYILKASYAYDPKTEKWTRLADLNRARHGHVAAAADGRVWVFRGVPCPGYGEMSSVESLPAADVK